MSSCRRSWSQTVARLGDFRPSSAPPYPPCLAIQGDVAGAERHSVKCSRRLVEVAIAPGRVGLCFTLRNRTNCCWFLLTFRTFKRWARGGEDEVVLSHNVAAGEAMNRDSTSRCKIQQPGRRRGGDTPTEGGKVDLKGNEVLSGWQLVVKMSTSAEAHSSGVRSDTIKAVVGLMLISWTAASIEERTTKFDKNVFLFCSRLFFTPP
jgi:hypothetical protein